MLVIISGASGAGKDTVKQALLKRLKNAETMPSFTSRAMREGDIPEKTYYFVSKEKFEEMIKNEEFYEYDVHHNNYYGVAKKILNEKLENGKTILKDIDVNGTENLIKLLKDKTKIVTIFLKVPKQELLKRLEDRIDNPSEEESKMPLYDYVLKNDDLEKTLQIIMTIIKNEEKTEK